jgi:hypothetical protein
MAELSQQRKEAERLTSRLHAETAAVMKAQSELTALQTNHMMVRNRSDVRPVCTTVVYKHVSSSSYSLQHICLGVHPTQTVTTICHRCRLLMQCRIHVLPVTTDLNFDRQCNCCRQHKRCMSVNCDKACSFWVCVCMCAGSGCTQPVSCRDDGSAESRGASQGRAAAGGEQQHRA